MSSSSKRKLNAISNLMNGSRVFFSLATWYSKKDQNKTIYGSKEELRKHIVEGIVKEVNQRRSGTPIFKIHFPLLDEEFFFDTKKLMANPLYYVNEFHVPKDAVIMTALAPDPVAVGKKLQTNKKPTLNSLLAENQRLQAIISKQAIALAQHSKTLDLVQFQVVNFASGRHLSFSFPKVLQIPVPQNPDHCDLSPRGKAALESKRNEAMLCLSIQTKVSDSKTLLKSCLQLFVANFKSQLKINYKKLQRSWDVTLPASFSFYIFNVLLELSTFKLHKKTAATLTFHGSLSALHKMGISRENDPDMECPFSHVDFYNESDVLFGSYYSQFRDQATQTYEFVINPSELTEEELRNDPRIKAELGETWTFKSVQETLHDIKMKRLSYKDEQEILKNYGVKGWCLVDGASPIMVVVSKLKDEIDLTKITVSYKVACRTFGIHKDLLTNCLLSHVDDGDDSFEAY